MRGEREIASDSATATLDAWDPVSLMDDHQLRALKSIGSQAVKPPSAAALTMSGSSMDTPSSKPVQPPFAAALEVSGSSMAGVMGRLETVERQVDMTLHGQAHSLRHQREIGDRGHEEALALVKDLATKIGAVEANSDQIADLVRRVEVLDNKLH